jgi:hypothetical protein
MFNKTTKLKLDFFSDSQNYSLIQSLEVDSCFGFQSCYPMSVALELTDDHLFANVKTLNGEKANLVRNIFLNDDLIQLT